MQRFATRSVRCFIGLGLGVGAGIFFGEGVAFLKIDGDAFIALLQITVIPYVMVALITSVDLRAGTDVVETLVQEGPNLILAGITVTLVPVCAGYVFGRRLLGMEPVLLLGALTGSMTSGASLKIVTDAAKSSEPALGYTGCYASANVLIEGNLIKQVSTKKIGAEGATVIDGGGRTLMPGLADTHVHLGFASLPQAQLFTGRPGYNYIYSVGDAEAMLMRGVPVAAR